MVRSRHWYPFLSLVLALLGACANEGPGGNLGGGAADAPNRLEPVGVTSLVLEPYAEAQVAFRYVRDDGSPIDGATIDLSLQGAAGEASLSATAARTNAEGIAEATLRAGAPSRFIVEAIGPRGEQAELEVEVRTLDFADLLYRVGYTGPRFVTSVEVGLFGNTRCAALAERVPAASAVQEATLGATGRFEGVQVGVAHALVALGIDARGYVAAETCADVTLDGVGESFVELTLSDVPEQLDGTYETVETFDVTEGFDPRMDALLSAMRGLSEDPAAYLVDYVAGRDGTPRWLREALSFPPTRAVVVDKLREVLGRIHVPDELARLLEVGAELERAFSAMTLRGAMQLGAPSEFQLSTGTHRVERIEVTLSRGTFQRTIAASAEVEVSFAEGLELREHELPVAFGDLVRLVLQEGVLATLPGSPATVTDYVTGLFDCEAIASDLAGDGSDAAPLVEAACDFGAAALGATIEGWILGLGEYDTLHLQGKASLVDSDGDYDRDRIERGAAQARWTGRDGELRFEGTFEGSRKDDTSGRSHRLREAMNRLH